jgi:hypothetical protein
MTGGAFESDKRLPFSIDISQKLGIEVWISYDPFNPAFDGLPYR